ncbi:MAG: DUF898 family protein [Leptotrichiaceae bacterium]|jgi:uncharacterized membrane protein YjgN (DUF898 family)
MEKGNLEVGTGKSYFDGGLLELILLGILGAVITTVTLGICAPWAICLIYKWEVEHTVVEGRRLKFTGTALGLFGSWIKLLLLIIVTLGIYSFWAIIFMIKWKSKNTAFA